MQKGLGRVCHVSNQLFPGIFVTILMLLLGQPGGGTIVETIT